MQEHPTPGIGRNRARDPLQTKAWPQGWSWDVPLAGSYFLLAAGALLFSRFQQGIALSWFATALLVPRLALTHPTRWGRPLLFCAAASVAATVLFGAGPSAAPGFALALLLEAGVAALMLRRFIPDGGYFDTVPRVGTFVLWVGVVAPGIAAFLGAAVGTIVMARPYWETWLHWSAAHSLGTLTLMPIITLALRPDTRQRLHEIRTKWGITDTSLVGLVLGINFAVFAQTHFPLLFLPMLPMMFLTLRHGRIGASGSIIVTAVIGGVLTAFGEGPVALIAGSPNIKVLFFQFFLAVCVIAALPMAGELTRRRILTQQLQKSEALFRLMADRSGDVLLNISPDGTLLYVSPSMETIGGYPPEQLLGTSSYDLLADEDKDGVRRAHRNALLNPDETFVFEYRGIRSDGRAVWYEAHVRAMVDEAGDVTGLIGAVRDVSHRKALESQLHDLATRDALTGLGNRRQFESSLAAEVALSIEERRQSCLVIVDLDHFKRINDDFGHSAGDAILRAVAAQFQSSLRKNDTVCRIGGEEFGFILREINIEDGAALCNRLREGVASASLKVDRSVVPVSVSLGIVSMARHDSVGDLITAADEALYRAKAAGRNRLVQAG